MYGSMKEEFFGIGFGEEYREDEPSVCLMHDWIYLPSA